MNVSFCCIIIILLIGLLPFVLCSSLLLREMRIDQVQTQWKEHSGIKRAGNHPSFGLAISFEIVECLSHTTID